MSVATGQRQRQRTKFWTDVPFTKAPTSPSGVLELSGYASTWGLDRDDEMVARDAFDKSIGAYLSKNPMVLWQHNMDWPIGSITGAHTDDTGLFVTAAIPDPGTNAADWQKGAYTAIRTGVVRTFSIGGYMYRDVKAGPDGPVFVIAEVVWFETSVVSIPANADSIFEAAIKALNGERPGMTEKAKNQMEQLLGFKAVTDPELAGMDEDARRERYEMLSGIFKRVHDSNPPGYDDFRRISKAIEAGVSPVKTAGATILVTRAFYHPESDESMDEKAGRAISAANSAKLQESLDAHDDLAGHLIDAAKSMESAAAAHKTATTKIKDVMGISDDDAAGEGSEDEEGDEAPNSPEKSASTKQLVSNVRALIQEAGQEKFGQAQPGQQFGPEVYVDDFDLDEGYAILCIYSRDGMELYKVSLLRGQGGDLALGDDEAEVIPVVSYQPKSAIVETLKRVDASARKFEEASDRADASTRAVDAVPAGEKATTPLTEDDIGDEDLEADMFAQAEFQKELAQAGMVITGQRGGKLSGDGQVKGALANADLPFAAQDRAWSGPAAKRRVHAKAKSGDEYDPAVLKQAYLWMDSGADPKAVTSYRFIVADVVGGDLTYVPRGIFAAAAVVQGARGGTTEEIATAIKPRLKALYSKMATKFDDDSIKPPWESDS